MSKVVSIMSLTRRHLENRKNPPSLEPVVSEKRVSQWEEVMRKFSESHKEECKTVPLDIPRVPRSLKTFPTGSQYEGSWDVLGMSGYGHYVFPNGVIYDGEFEDGMFHGFGELRYQSGIILRGRWEKGVMTERTLVFADGLEYDECDWKYSKTPDRRFTKEYDVGLQPAGMSFATPRQPTRDIPPGYYDNEEGFYDPKTKAVYKADDISHVLRAPETNELNWIVKNCRTNPEESTGPRQDLYETWSKPEVKPEPSPQPAASSRGGSVLRSQYNYEQELESNTEVEFRNLEEDTSASSSSSDEVFSPK